MSGEFITLLGLNASWGMTVGHWRLYYDESSGCFYWARPDDAREPTWPVIWATPYHEGSRGIVVQVQDEDGTMDDPREVEFDGTLAGYKRAMRAVLTMSL